MDSAFAQGRRVRYSRARLALLGIGLAILFLIAAMMLARGVVRDEVLGILLFIPVFVALVFWKEVGGAIGAVVATLGYSALIYDAVQTAGLDRLIGQFSSRAIAYLLFGILGGWATRQLETSLTKLELYDQIDDATGLFNARFFIQDTDLELSRSKRYQTIFSIAAVDIPTVLLEPLSRRQEKGILRELGRLLQSSVRTVDRVVYGQDAQMHRLAVVLPETGADGVRIFTERLAENLGEFLKQRGVAASGRIRSYFVVFPDDEQGLAKLRNDFMEIDKAQHPEEVEEVPRSAQQ